MRRLILTTASVLALGIGGAGIGHAAGYSSGNTGLTPIPQARTQPMTPRASARVTPTQIKQAQAKLRQKGLYRDRIDGILGPDTKTALLKYQRRNGLTATGKLDRRTMASLSGHMTAGQGSSMPSGAGAVTGMPSSSTNSPSATPMTPLNGQPATLPSPGSATPGAKGASPSSKY